MVKQQTTTLILLSTLLPRAIAQVDGVCSCGPRTFEFSLNFSLPCPFTEKSPNPGINETRCSIKSITDTTDFIPVVATVFQTLELDRNGLVLSSSEKPGNFSNGATFSYTSASATRASLVKDIPGAIVVVVYGNNAEGSQLELTWVTKYSNNCSAYPVFSAGESAGWFVVVCQIDRTVLDGLETICNTEY